MDRAPLSTFHALKAAKVLLGKGDEKFLLYHRSSLGDSDSPARFVFQAPHRNPIDAARRDGEEGREALFGDIDGKTVHRNPFSNTNSNGSNFAIFHPNASETIAASRLHAEVLARADEGFFKYAKMFVKILAARVEIENRVTHKLTGAVIGRLTTPIDFMNRKRQQT